MTSAEVRSLLKRSLLIVLTPVALAVVGAAALVVYARGTLAARRNGRSVHLNRPELSEALDDYWGDPLTEALARGRARTRSLLTWRVSG